MMNTSGDLTDYFQTEKSARKISSNSVNKKLKFDHSDSDRSLSSDNINESNASFDDYFNLNKAETALQHSFGFNGFRSNQQRDAILEALSNENDLLVLMPTASGKSLTYQLPAVCETSNLDSSARGSVTIVISPLRALIKDQVSYLKKLKISVKSYTNTTKREKRREIEAQFMTDTVRIALLYITPEMAMKSTRIGQIIEHLYNTQQLKRIVIDEVHLVVEWGYKFRPQYLKLGELKQRYPSVQWIALSASMSAHIINEMKTVLKLREPVSEFMCSNYRQNLYYEVVFKDITSDHEFKLKQFISQQICLNDSMNEDINNNKVDVGIIYCREKSTCNILAKNLRNLGVICEPFHSDIDEKKRDVIQKQWMSAEVQCLVSTLSIGLGINNPNVRFVVHWNVPFSLSYYYQQSGRAGRDGRAARCRIYYSSKDKDRNYSLLDRASKNGSQDNKYTKQDFNAMVEYCESGGGCRHKMLMDFITDDRLRNGCKHVCDLCVNQESVIRALNQYKEKTKN